MEERDGIVRVRHQTPNNWSGEARLIVEVPADARVRIERVGGNFEVSDLGAAVTASSINGNARLNDFAAAFTAETIHGNLNANDVGGDLRVGKVGGSARISDVEGACRLEKVGGNVTLGDVAGHCELGGVGGNLKLTDVDGHVLATVHGGAKVNDISGHCKLERVGGNLQLADVDGMVEATVQGSARVADIDGFCKLERVGGNLELADVNGAVEAAVGGSATLTLDIQHSQQIHVQAGGNINAHINTDDAEFVLQSGGATTVSGLPNGSGVTIDEPYSFTVGDGSARIELTAGGNVTVTGDKSVNFTFDFDWGDRNFMRSGGFDFTDFGNLGDKISREVQQRVREALGRSEQKMDEAMRKAEARAERAARRASGHDRRYRQPPTPPTPSIPPTPPSPSRPTTEPVSDEERRLVMEMAQEGKITKEEAARLLAALNKSAS